MKAFKCINLQFILFLKFFNLITVPRSFYVFPHVAVLVIVVVVHLSIVV